MSDAINNFRLKVQNSKKLKRPTINFSTKEADELETAISELEKKIKSLEKEVLKERTLTIDLIGSTF